jgi:hypothetical protein
MFHFTYFAENSVTWVNIFVNAKIGLAQGHIFVMTSSAIFVKRATRTHPDTNDISHPGTKIPILYEYNTKSWSDQHTFWFRQDGTQDYL